MLILTVDAANVWQLRRPFKERAVIAIAGNGRWFFKCIFILAGRLADLIFD